MKNPHPYYHVFKQNKIYDTGASDMLYAGYFDESYYEIYKWEYLPHFDCYNKKTIGMCLIDNFKDCLEKGIWILQNED